MESKESVDDTTNVLSIVDSLKSFIRGICPSILNLDQSGATNMELALENMETTDILTKYTTSADVMVLYVEKIAVEGSSSTEVTTSFGLRIQPSQRLLSSFAIIKSRENALDQRPISCQVQIITLLGGIERGGEMDTRSLFLMLQQFTRHSFEPLVRLGGQNAQASLDASEADNISTLQRRIRELDLALDQCQRGTLIPKVSLPTLPSLVESSSKSSVAALRGYLDKFNPSQADQFFIELGLYIGLDSTVQKEEFAANVSKIAKQWPTEITKQTRLVMSPFPSSIEKEVDFWKELDKKILDTKEQLESPAILLTKLVLKRTNRVSEQLIREAEAELDKAVKLADEALKFLRDFPIMELLSATELSQLSKAVGNCLQHFSRLKYNSNYDYARSVRLLEALGTAFHGRLLGILRERNVMHCPLEDFRKAKGDVDLVFAAWSQHLPVATTILSEIAKRRHQAKLPVLRFDHETLQQRLKIVAEFREQHERLLSVFSNVLSDENNDVTTELNESYKPFLRSDMDVLDVGSDGQAAWLSARQMYEKRLERAEDRITALLEERLSNSKTAEEMFRVFSVFNPLFFRPAIRNAVNSFRTALVKSVREDVKRLQEKFRLRYDESQERVTADIRDIPPLSGRIIWARQIENQLSTLMKRMEDVLGAGWQDHFEGKQLKEVCDELRNYLDTEQLIKDWFGQQIKTEENKFTKCLLLVEDDPRTHRKFLRVNFDSKQVVLFKEVRYLEWLLPAGKTIPSTVRSLSKVAFTRYPIAMALQAALSTFIQAKKGITTENSILLVTYILGVREMIKEAMGGSSRSKRWIKWDTSDLNDWVGQFSNKVYSLQERVDDVTEKMSSIHTLLQNLRVCPYERKIMDDIVRAIQGLVDELQMRGLSNIGVWVASIDKKMEGILSSRLKVAIRSWSSSFVGGGGGRTSSSSADLGEEENKADADSNDNSDDATAATKMMFTEDGVEYLEMDQTVHEVLLANQTLYIAPPLEQARSVWVASFHHHMSVSCTLPRITSTRYQVFAEAVDGPKDYSNIISMVDPKDLRLPYTVVEDKVSQAKIYAQKWLQYQALWDVSVAVVADRVGRDISKWQQLLQELKASRSTIESADEEEIFGPIVINYRQVQNKVNLKYDTWQKECQLRFGAILMEEIKLVHSELLSWKQQLESVYLEGPTKDAIGGVEFIIKMKSNIGIKQKLVLDLESSEKLLQKQRYHFPREWLSASNATGAMSDLLQILERRASQMDAHLPALQLKLREEDAQVSVRVEELLVSWEKERPLEGNHTPVAALQTVSMYLTQANRLSEDVGRIRGAKGALGMDYLADERLSFTLQEMNDLNEAWHAVLPAWEKIQTMRAQIFKDLVTTKIRKQLDEISEDLRALPIKVRTYASFEMLLSTVSKYLALQSVLKDLCTDALKERHWRTLQKSLNLTVLPSELTLGDLWSCDLHAHRKQITEVLSVAQGELALEQFLKDLKEYWVTSELSLITRENVRLITAWDVLFSMLEDHLNSLASLKQSPYYRNVQEFQEDTANWEGRLTSLRSIFTIWVEVQRKWVYLRGIFRNPDIKAQLPAQFSKFKSVDNEFMGLMKRINLKPTVLDLLQVDNLARQLERQDSTMTIIQKALGEYLERQRQIFPRFYFVNNDDLVEIIGNSNEPTKILTHISKMFAAMSGVNIANTATDSSGNGNSSSDSVLATDMCSKEGEFVKLITPVNMSVGVKEWLGMLEGEMVTTLATLLQDAVTSMPTEHEALIAWTDKFPAQVVILSSQVAWSEGTETALSGDLSSLLQSLENRLRVLSESVLKDVPPALRKKCEQLITEVVHQRDVTRLLMSSKVSDKNDFNWLYHLRFYWSPKEKNLMQRLCIRMSNASFFYGFEYLGIGERLVQTPLTDRCYLTLTQALHFRMGGNPFGPAGTGKTESVKMLGAQLGRFVLVFNCDENFDYAAMGRIFAGLCQVGAWGCFDEFNRLEERILSAVSQQILTIQRGLMTQQEQIELLGNSTKLNKDVGIFVTMNPGYAGRSNLPDNLKQLFRAVAMVVPDRKLIAQVMLFSQGIISAEDLAGKVVLLFTLCEEQLSAQSHYDFGLRALKSVLTGAGDLKRVALQSLADKDCDMAEVERDVLIKSICNSVVPKLVAEDISLFTSLLQAVFPGTELPAVQEVALIEAIKAVCEEDSLECGDLWIEKVLQLKQVLDLRHGVMMVGPSCTGKSSAWKVLLKALARTDGCKGESFVIDPKSIKKDKLYGTLDANTLEWTDGIFTKVLRRVAETDALRGGARRVWIIFDGDVDPEWAENLNSVLDDNKILTLPSGDRLKVPNNVRIMMEVDTLKYATMATVSRCGMVWFPDQTVTLDMMLRQQLRLLKKESVQSLESSSFIGNTNSSQTHKTTQERFVEVITPYFLNKPGLVEIALNFALLQPHIMEASTGRLLTTLYSLLVRGMAMAIDHNEANTDFPMTDAQMESFGMKWLLHSLLWAFGGSMSWEYRFALGDHLLGHCNVDTNSKLLDLQVNVSDGSWTEWAALVPRMEIESHKVTSTDVVVTTTDTVRHIEVLRAWLNSHKPLILCGPPGSGKTMTLTSVIDAMPEFILAALNFSSSTTPDLILKTFAQFCEVVDSPDGLIMQPNRQSYSENRWLVIFCDEINLPEEDKYGTQRVIMFMRQLTEQGGFWNNDCKWVHLRRIQFVGACNPPTDAGRTPLSMRFMRHAPLLLVDYPAESSLKQIYRCFNQALVKLHPNLRGYADPLTDAMVDFYLRNQEKFTPDMAPQYIYSPRELSRWVRAMYEAMEPMEGMTAEELVRLWAHEALRLFHDRLISDEEKQWCNAQIDEVASIHFPGVDTEKCLVRPMLYSNWIQKCYQSVKQDELKSFVTARLKIFYEEELDVPLVIFDDVLEHVLRIDNVLRHPMGHLLLVGDSGVGKTVLSRFVSWMNGLTVFQIKANKRYTIEQFDEDLRALLRRVGIEGEKICFIFDESNALSSAFLERMNALLASGEVPGLFEGDELTQLMAACRESFIQKEGLMMDSEDELWRSFTRIIQKNLHVVFTMNPAASDFANRCTTSPALFNRCVVDWFGTWSQSALAQVAYEFTLQLDTGYTSYTTPMGTGDVFAMVMDVIDSDIPGLREAVVAALVSFHNSVKTVTIKMGKATGRQHYISPRDFLDIIRKFVAVEHEKRTFLEDQQTHIRTGLDKLLETQDQVASLRQEMVAKEVVLRAKDAEANQKLTLMVDKQNEAEQRKAVAEQLTKELQHQNEEINVRRATVESELSEAEPSLMAAKQSVQNIRKAQLDEVRALARPPAAIQRTLEMVAVMIGEKTTDWAELRKIIRKDDFIATVVNFDPLALNMKQVKKVEDEYLNKGDMDYASVDRASKACGPLYMWAESQIKYSSILRRVKPLRDEMESLQERSAEMEGRQIEALTQVADMEAAIKRYKSEYASAIRDTETIKAEMDIVTKKVCRAESLLASLDEEKGRWQATSTSFDKQMSTLIGDSLLAAAFLTYGGIFDHRMRKNLSSEWTETLESLGIPFHTDLNVIGYLSRPSDQLAWKGFGLPDDELALQNAILLERFNRFPLVVDPSGQATSFLLQKYASQKIVNTSFLDVSFLKTLASAIRFGTPVLVQDVESIDPILNPVLNKELQKTGGRTLIRLGNEDIDFSPKFMIVLTTRNPLAAFPPDLCSRVTMVNFTVTPASLEAQALSAILKAERPDVDRRRTEMLRLQGEQSVKLRELEETLLDKIRSVQGAILDDDTVIKTLESIKGEAADLNREVTKTREVMSELKAVSNTYEPLAIAMAAVYFSMERLADVSFLYQFSIQYFLEIVHKVLSQASVTVTTTESMVIDAKAAKLRLQTLSMSFYREISRRTLRGLKYSDKLMFVARLAQISTQGQTKCELSDTETDLLLRGGAPLLVESNNPMLTRFRDVIPGHSFSEGITRQLLSLSLLPAFSGLHSSMNNNNNNNETSSSSSSAWMDMLSSDHPEKTIPTDWMMGSEPNVTAPRAALLGAMITRALRPDRVMAAIDNYVSSVFGEAFQWGDFCNVDLREIVEHDSKASVPLMLCSDAGQDASGRVDTLATACGKTLLQVSMGSAEGYAEADRSIAQASKSGAWVLLRNVHLCPEWLSMLEKRLHGMTTNENFRLFLTCEINPKIPTELLRMSDVVVFEASTGMKANMVRFFNTLPAARVDKAPAERSRLYALLAWFNAVVHERLRYTPLGWTKRYEFNEADTACALDVIDEWVDEVAGPRAHVAPADLPWQALRTLLSQSLYGGRVDNTFDQLSLDSFINTIFRPESFGSLAVLAMDHSSGNGSEGKPLLVLPEGSNRSAFESWIAALPNSNSPLLLGLPASAENQLQNLMGQRLLSRLAVVQGVFDADESTSLQGDSTKSRLKGVLDTVGRWLAVLPLQDTLPLVDSTRASDASSSSIQRSLAREVARGAAVLKRVRTDLLSVCSYCNGEIKATNALRDLILCINKGVVPTVWKNEFVTAHATIGTWVSDLALRIKALQRYGGILGKQSSAGGDGCSFWLGGMFSPESFVTATRQYTAQMNKWSLEELELYLEIGSGGGDGSSSSSSSSSSTIVEGLVLEGASWRDGNDAGLSLSSELRCTLPPSRLRWCRRQDKVAAGDFCSFPVYLNELRTSLVVDVLVRLPSAVNRHVWAQRGTAFVLQAS
eukprot:gene303-544_t